MYKNLRIFKTREDAKDYAKGFGYTEDGTSFSLGATTRCSCGETEVAIFEDKDGRELALGIYASCGE